MLVAVIQVRPVQLKVTGHMRPLQAALPPLLLSSRNRGTLASRSTFAFRSAIQCIAVLVGPSELARRRRSTWRYPRRADGPGGGKPSTKKTPPPEFHPPYERRNLLITAID